MPHVGQIDPANFQSQRKHISQNQPEPQLHPEQYQSLAQRRYVFPHAQTNSLPNQKHRKPEQSEDPSRFSTEDYAVILLLKSPISHENQLFSQRKYVYPFYFLYFYSNRLSKTKVFYFKQLISSPVISPTQPDIHPLNCPNPYGKHPCPYGALPHPKGGSYLERIHLPR